MQERTYTFDTIDRVLDDEVHTVRDYFQYYTTGVESVPQENDLFVTERRPNERYEVLSYSLFNNENLAGMLTAINNDVFLWNMPMDSDGEDLNVKILYDYIQKLYKSPIPPQDVSLWENIAKDKVDFINTKYQVVLVPQVKSLQKLSRKIKDYFESRVVK